MKTFHDCYRSSSVAAAELEPPAARAALHKPAQPTGRQTVRDCCRLPFVAAMAMEALAARAVPLPVAM